MKLTDLWKTRQKPTISFELFPARTPKGAEKMDVAIDELAALQPDFVSVTFGAGGSTREGSHQLIEKLVKEKGATTTPAITPAEQVDASKGTKKDGQTHQVN